MAELGFERFSGKIETVRGTAVTPPDYDMGLTGMLTVNQEVVTVDENYGLLTTSTDDDQLVRKGAEWSGDGVANTDRLPWQLNLAVKGGVTAPLTNNKVVDGTTTLVGGTGYTTAPVVTVTGGTPKVPAKIVATVNAGAVTALTIVNPGEGYASAPTLAFGGPGSGASATATVATPTTAKLWEFPRTLTADDLASATLYWGDPAVQIFQSAFAMAQEFSMDGDASGTDLVAVSMNGIGKFPAKVAAPAFPAAVSGHYLIPKSLQLWMDPATGNFGDTEIVGRVVSAALTIPTGIVPKYLGEGPGGTLSYSRVGREKTQPVLTVVFEFLDSTQYDLAVATGSGTRQKVRARWSGGLIETSGAAAFYHFGEVDIYGRPTLSDWGDLEGTNRTLEITVPASYLSTAGTDLTVRVQGIKTAL